MDLVQVAVREFGDGEPALRHRPYQSFAGQVAEGSRTGVADTPRRSAKRSVRELIVFAAKSDVQGLLSADRRFHLGLVKLSGNRRLVDVTSKLLDQQRMYRLPSDRATSDQLRESAERHSRILEAIRNRDADATRTLMIDHFVYARGGRIGPLEEDGRGPAAKPR